MPDWLKNGRCLGHRLPALFAALGAQLGDRRFRGSGAPRRDRRGGRRGFRRRQSAARAVPGGAGARQPLLALEPRVPEPALHRDRQGAGLRRHGGCARRRRRKSAPPSSSTTGRVAAPEDEGARHPLPHLPGARRGRRRDGFRALRRSTRGAAALSPRALRDALGGDGAAGERRRPGTAGRRNSAIRRRDAVRAFAEEQRELVTFHTWLQWLADRQLAEAQARGARARACGIGLYLDLAVGVAPDGSATWSDRGLVIPTARIGAPPDYFNANGQDWGLAPLSPAGLVARELRALPRRARRGRAPRRRAPHRPRHEPLPAVLDRRGLRRRRRRLCALPLPRDAADARRGLAGAPDDHHRRGPRRRAGGLSRGDAEDARSRAIASSSSKSAATSSTSRPKHYPREALACVSIHDLHTLAGWWSGHDIDVRDEDRHAARRRAARRARQLRAHQRRRALGLLAEKGLMPADMAPVLRGESGGAATTLPESLAVAFHRLVARTPSRLFVVQAEELTGAVDQVNIPGTVAEHPNWRRKLSVDLEELPDAPLFRAITAALAGRAAETAALSDSQLRFTRPRLPRMFRAHTGWAPWGEFDARDRPRFIVFARFSSGPSPSTRSTFPGTTARRHRGRRLFRRRLRRPQGRRPGRVQGRLQRTTSSARPSPTTPPRAGAS